MKSNTQIEISEDDFKCPISKMVFSDPAMVLPCSHTFEREEINKWRKENNFCPCCNAKITELISLPPYINEHFDLLLKSDKELEKKRYAYTNQQNISSKNSKSLKKCSIKIELNSKNFIDIFSLNIFLDPVMVTCGHLFERKLIEKQLEEKNNCPCCRSKNIQIYPLPLYIKNNFDFLLKTEPQLQNKRYFDLITFEDCLKKNLLFELKLLENNKLSQQLLLMIDVLRHSEKRINAISKEKNQEGLSALFFLTLYKKGRKLILENKTLRDRISVKTLHTCVEAEGCHKGDSPAKKLCRDGKKILKSDPSFAAKVHGISLEELLIQAKDFSFLFKKDKSTKQTIFDLLLFYNDKIVLTELKDNNDLSLLEYLIKNNFRGKACDVLHSIKIDEYIEEEYADKLLNLLGDTTNDYLKNLLLEKSGRMKKEEIMHYDFNVRSFSIRNVTPIQFDTYSLSKKNN